MSTQNQEPTIISIRKLTDDCRFVKPVLIEYETNGKLKKSEACLAHDCVVIILYNKTTNKLVFVKQFRPAVMICSIYDHKMEKRTVPLKSNGYTLELCAGIVDKAGKNVYEIAREEILEEVGFDIDIKDIQLVTTFRSSTSFNGAMVNLFFAEIDESKRVNQGGGIDSESIQVIELTFDEVREKVVNCTDDESIFSRSSAVLFGINWFLYEYLPKLDKK